MWGMGQEGPPAFNSLGRPFFWSHFLERVPEPALGPQVFSKTESLH